MIKNRLLINKLKIIILIVENFVTIWPEKFWETGGRGANQNFVLGPTEAITATTFVLINVYRRFYLLNSELRFKEAIKSNER